MSTQSKYNDSDIANIIENNDYTRISGQHISGNSVHGCRCNKCGGINYKTSKSLVTDKSSKSKSKAGCVFIPCNPRGKISMEYLTTVAKERGCDAVKRLDSAECNKLSSKEKLVWSKGKKIMTQSWHEVRTRADSMKKGQFFIADDERRKPAAALMRKDLAVLCKERGLKLPANLPAQIPQGQHFTGPYTHKLCNHEIKMPYKQLTRWNERKCRACYPPSQEHNKKFKDFLKERGMRYRGILSLNEKGTQVDRKQKLEITCLHCGNENRSRSYDEIWYRGFFSCEKPLCINAGLPEDRVGESAEYYIQMLKKTKVKSCAEAQKLFPVSMKHVRCSYEQDENGNQICGAKYRKIQSTMGWVNNELTQDFDDSEVREAISCAINNGATNKKEIRAKLPKAMNNFLKRCPKDKNPLLNGFLDEINFASKKSIEINGPEDGIEFVKGIQREYPEDADRAWSIICNGKPSVARAINAGGWKDEVLAACGLKQLDKFKGLTDEALVKQAEKICREKGLSNIGDLELECYGIVANLRERGLVDRLCKNMGFHQNNDWSGYNFEKTLQRLRAEECASSTCWHVKLPGFYKHAKKQIWFEDVSKEMKWGNWEGLDGYMYASKTELIIANLLRVAGVDYIRQPKISAFRGIRGGCLRGDFCIEVGGSGKTVWVEVWAYQLTEFPDPDGSLGTYVDSRFHKEPLYSVHKYSLCSIEGGVLYRPQTIDGLYRKKGMERFIRHACERLNSCGIAITYEDKLVKKINKSLIRN